ncbi:hypothetical protein [Streptomyces sp. CBMA156]|uniref:hypothetical protein n=1 Tax=Streptomyces sp. CBMA156 TaxID=1930280 RepID=UPI001661FD07|nr:hypothetical protein [Streptomyces sp. CBMA156]MBD0675667.1 hypothetical protein [Streptomyces sp. CBMA156]
MSTPEAVGLLPIHIARKPRQPKPFAPIVLSVNSTVPDGQLREEPRPAEPDRAALGVEPRWTGTDTSDCAAVLSPNRGPATEQEAYTRYAAGARQRGETALVIALAGAGPYTRSAFHGDVAPSINLPEDNGAIGLQRLPSGIRPRPADNLDDAEHDLALRLLNRPAEATWSRLTLQQARIPMARGTAIWESGPPTGTLRPILVDGLGDPVAGVWVPDDGSARWFVVPHDTDLGRLTDWLMHKALPLYAPGALVRARSPLVRDPALATAAEARLRTQIADHQRAYEERKAELDVRLAEAQALADPLRYTLLYGTGRLLEDAVQEAFTAAGLAVTRLDDELGTQSADLLVESAGRRVLVEVKSAGGPASENLVDKLRKHQQTWEALRPGEPLDDGLLVVNHQTRLPPNERAGAVYSRPPFVATLDVGVLGTVQLFDWWRQEDWEAIRRAVVGGPEAAAPVTAP